MAVIHEYSLVYELRQGDNTLPIIFVLHLFRKKETTITGPLFQELSFKILHSSHLSLISGTKPGHQGISTLHLWMLWKLVVKKKSVEKGLRSLECKEVLSRVLKA